MYEQYREYLLAIVSAATFLAGFNALILVQLVERRLVSLTQIKGASRLERLPIAFLLAGTVALLSSIELAVSGILLFPEGVANLPSTAYSQVALAGNVFTAGFILSFLGILLIVYRVWTVAPKSGAGA